MPIFEVIPDEAVVPIAFALGLAAGIAYGAIRGYRTGWSHGYMRRKLEELSERSQ